MVAYLFPALCVLFVFGLAIFFKVSGALVFLLLVAGTVIQRQMGTDAAVLASGGLPGQTQLVESFVRIGLVALPFVISLFLLRGTLVRAKLPLHIIPLLAAASVCLLALPELLSSAQATSLVSSSVYVTLDKFHVAVYLIGVLSSLLLLSVELPKHHDRHSKHGH